MTEQEFAEWFSANYPKDTIIHDPMWHASRIYRRAQLAAAPSAPSDPALKPWDDLATFVAERFPAPEPVAWVTKAALRHWAEHKGEGPQEYTFLPRALNGWDMQADLQVPLYAAPAPSDDKDKRIAELEAQLPSPAKAELMVAVEELTFEIERLRAAPARQMLTVELEKLIVAQAAQIEELAAELREARNE
jgi:hypothetical protein